MVPTSKVVPSSEILPISVNPRKRRSSTTAEQLEANGFAPFKSDEAAPAVPAGGEQIVRDLAALQLDSAPSMFVNANQQKESRLMSLPAELRNRIYALALSPYVRIRKDRSEVKRGVMSAPALLLTCKRIHQEATGIFYSNTIFVNGGGSIVYRHGRFDDLHTWLRTIGPERVSQIQDVWISSFDACHMPVLEGDDDFADKSMQVCVIDMLKVRLFAENICGKPVWDAHVVKTELYCELPIHTEYGRGAVWTSDPEKLRAAFFAMRNEVSSKIAFQERC